MTRTDDELVEACFDELALGATETTELVWARAEVDAFRELTRDDAPVHRDPAFAGSLGFPGPIVHGLLAAAPFSRLLGCRLPGTLSVIHTLRFDFVQPVREGEPVVYTVRIGQLSPSTKTAVLDLSATRPDGTTLLRGRAQCGLAR